MRRVVAMVGTAVLGMGLAALVSAGPAAAAGCSITSYTPTDVGVPYIGEYVAPTVRLSGCSSSHWTFEIPALSVTYPDTSKQPLYLVAHDTGHIPSGVIAIALDDADAGPHNVVIKPADGSSQTFNAGVSIRRDTRWSFPTTSVAGDQLTMSDTMLRDNWNTGHQPGYSDRSVTLQYKTAASTPWRRMALVTTDSAGLATTTVTMPSGKGRWRFHYGGNASSENANSPTIRITAP